MHVFNIRDLGASGDGARLDTAAIQSTIDLCAAQGGGTVYFPAGRYVSGSIFLRSHITLHIDAGATLLGSEEAADYPIINSRWEGSEQLTHASLIAGEHLTNIAITGRGIIDGRGATWWRRYREQTLDHPRPRLIAFADCSNVLIKDITVTRSPSWTIHPLRCDNVTIDNVSVVNPLDSPNTDGINPDSCSNVRIANCYISVGDDCIAIKSGTEHEVAEKRTPCRNITITNCTMAHGHGGVVIGSEMSGDVRNVVISNCVFSGTDRGIRLKSRRGRGGIVEDIRVSNVVMTDVLCPFTMNLYYAVGKRGDKTVSDKRPRPVDEGTPRFRRVHLSHITARDVKLAAAFLFGLAEMPIKDVSLSDVSISMSSDAEPGYAEMADDIERMQRAGLFARNVHGLRLHNVEVSGQQGAALRLIDTRNVFVHGCVASTESQVYLAVEGQHSTGIVLRGNHLAHAKQPLQLADDVRHDAVHIE